MNLIDLQDKLKNFSEQQLIQEMQMPTGETPQFLLLSEITRRKKMREAFEQEQGKEQNSTVAQDVVAAAGMPMGFASQMAGNMAPQTDMAGNTGAMPQQSSMPPQRMAGGGIVALQDGGRVSNTPRLVVRGGRQFAEMGDGSLVPLSALGFDEAELSGAGGADLAAPGSSVRQGPIPSQGDLDRRFSQEAVGINAVPSRLPAYGADSFMDATLPGAESPVLVGGGNAVGASRVMFGLDGPDMAAARSWPPRIQGEARLPRVPLAPDTFQESFDYGEGQSRPPREPRVPQDMALNEMDRLYMNEAAMDRGPRSRRPEVTLRGETPAVEDTGQGYIDPTQVTQGELPSLVQSLMSASSGVPTIGGYEAAYPETAAAAETPAAPQVEVPDEDTTRPVARPDAVADTGGGSAPSGGRAPSGGGGAGGIAAVAAQGAGSPSNFEQELLNMLAAREKRATQDKWLALAQAGMALMSSKDPTFGGALGEAGAVGLGALREGQSGAEADRLALLGQIEQSRMGREKLDLERQALAARSAARGGGGVKPLPAGFLTKLTDDLQAEQEALNALGPVPKPGLFFDRPDPAAPERLRRAQRIQNLQNQINFAYMPYGMMPYSSGGDDVPDLSD